MYGFVGRGHGITANRVMSLQIQRVLQFFLYVMYIYLYTLSYYDIIKAICVLN